MSAASTDAVREMETAASNLLGSAVGIADAMLTGQQPHPAVVEMYRRDRERYDAARTALAAEVGA